MADFSWSSLSEWVPGRTAATGGGPRYLERMQSLFPEAGKILTGFGTSEPDQLHHDMWMLDTTKTVVSEMWTEVTPRAFPKVTSTGNKLTLVFQTDPAWQKLGFSATWTTLTNGVVDAAIDPATTTVSMCPGGSSDALSGTLTDGTPEKVYWATTDCEMQIVAPEGSQIELTFQELAIEMNVSSTTTTSAVSFEILDEFLTTCFRVTNSMTTYTSMMAKELTVKY